MRCRGRSRFHTPERTLIKFIPRHAFVIGWAVFCGIASGLTQVIDGPGAYGLYTAELCAGMLLVVLVFRMERDGQRDRAEHAEAREAEAREQASIQREKVTHIRSAIFEAYLDSMAGTTPESQAVYTKLRDLHELVREIEYPTTTVDEPELADAQ
jgi:hypothetical protein